MKYFILAMFLAGCSSYKVPKECLEMNKMKTQIKEHSAVFVGEDENSRNWFGVYSKDKEYILIEWSDVMACKISKGSTIK